ncbi:TonB-dependent receptor [Olivibacter ginsenosidimutans]|uniref:TonB-dependent receptor n=2 Tax=Olivibacter ginsenosidimutans TaxID=1176537 RepID=A0ABP9BTZ2_9SPHI
MKLTILLIVIFSLNASTKVLSQITIRAEYAPLEDIFSQIEKQSGYHFFYKIKSIKEASASVNIQNAPVQDALKSVLKDQPFEFAIVDKTVVIKAKKANEGTDLIGQQLNIKGKVSNKDKEPLSGVTVTEKGTTHRSITNDDGTFTLSVQSSSSSIEFRLLGYLKKEISASSFPTDVILEEELVSLEDVVVVGYGTQKKENLTGAIATISSEDMIKRPVMRASSALQGLAPGLTVTQRSGQPGSDGGALRIRGVGTMTMENNSAKSNPLVLIDGVEGNIDGIDPNDIESVSVLKDAASASIYGSRAANGVILVTTKTGKGEQLSVSYNNYIGWQRFTALPDYANGYTYMTKLNEAYANMGKTPLYSDEYLQEYLANYQQDPDHYPNTDWQKEVYSGSGAVQNHYLAINGGKKVNVHSSFGFQDQKGVIPNYGSKRYSLRLNAKMNVLDNLQATILLSARHSPITTPANIDDIIIGVNRTAPIYAAQYSDGRYGAALNGYNPLAQVREGGTGENTYDNFRSTFQVNYQPIKGMDLELSYTPDFNLENGKRFTKAMDTYEFDSETPAFTVPTRTSLNQSQSKSWENTLRMLGRYSRDFQDHHFKFLAGYEQIDYSVDNMTAKREGFPFPEYPQLDAGSIEFMTNSGSASEWALRSFFGRLNYDYKGKYLFEANIRLDGSSRFYEGYKWGTFTSFSAGWRISEESFLQDQQWLSELKLRASWGQLGNQLIGNYPFASVIELGQNYVFGNQPATGGTQLDMANTEITWESTTSTDVGVDIGLWNRLDLSVDYYIRNTNDILLTLPVPALIGQSAPYQNAGKVRNKGWDFSLNYNQTINDFSYRVGLNLSDVHNEVIDLKGASPIINGYTINQEGLPIDALYGYRALGLFQSQEEIDHSPEQIGIYTPGDIKYEDVNGDGKIGSDDRVPIGSTIPRYTYGLNFNAKYKGFDLSFFIQGVGKADVLLTQDAAWAFYNAGKIKTWQLDAWTPDNPDAKYPRLTAERTHNNYENSSFWVYNAAYLRLKNLQIGYTLPTSWMSHLPFQSVRIYATGDNLWTKHHMPEGWDPERPNGNATVYPIAKTYTFGLNLVL